MYFLGRLYRYGMEADYVCMSITKDITEFLFDS